MHNGGNLPELVKYENNIKDITITKFAGADAGEFGDCYFVKFTEIIETEEEQRGFLWLKKKVKNVVERERMLPFTFKNYEMAKDFVQYLPGMVIEGERLFKKFKNTKMVLYETYQLIINGISVIIYLKFVPSCEHYTTQIRKPKGQEERDEYYINDLDKKFFNDSQGNWYRHEELIVDGFFTTFDMKILSDGSKHIIPKTLFSNISDIKQIETNNTHKFALVEND